jgi:hypothetical protein
MNEADLGEKRRRQTALQQILLRDGVVPLEEEVRLELLLDGVGQVEMRQKQSKRTQLAVKLARVGINELHHVRDVADHEREEEGAGKENHHGEAALRCSLG